jgi:hypothetical protein
LNFVFFSFCVLVEGAWAEEVVDFLHHDLQEVAVPLELVPLLQVEVALKKKKAKKKKLEWRDIANSFLNVKRLSVDKRALQKYIFEESQSVKTIVKNQIFLPVLKEREKKGKRKKWKKEGKRTTRKQNEEKEGKRKGKETTKRKAWLRQKKKQKEQETVWEAIFCHSDFLFNLTCRLC